MVKGQSRINVDGNLIGVIKVDGQDYICLTDMVRNSGDEVNLYNWLRNRNTVEFLGIWEQIHNQNFKPIEFDRFRKEAGLNNFSLSPKKWIENTNAIGIISKSGKNGGTYAHQDIAFEFGAWLSAEFKLLLIKEFQRLKAKELELEQWDYRRFLSKVNYRLHTDAIKENIIPTHNFPKDKEWLVYADEADILNMAVFGCTAKYWKEKNPNLVKKGLNMRDVANIPQLTVMANIENLNATYIADGIKKEERFRKLKNVAETQLSSLLDYYKMPSLNLSQQPKLTIDKPFDETVSRLLNVKRPKSD